MILKAVAEGKSNIQIASHSRGAVESILISHELKRIKEALKADPKKTIFKILLESPCSYTKAGVEKLFKEVNESVQDEAAALAERLSSAKINLFLMDPVPGGSYRGLSLVGWRDERFYQPSPANSTELLIARNERTRCF